MAAVASQLRLWEQPTLRSTTRVAVVDKARGLAIVLMLLDHALVFAMHRSPGGSGADDLMYVLRMTVTRASLPLFMLCTGVLLVRRRPSADRLLLVASWGLMLSVLLEASNTGLRAPEILMVWSLVMSVGWVIAAYPTLTIVLGALQASLWQIDWHGYQPGFVAMFIAVGVLSGSPALRWADRLPTWLSTVGRRPLLWYVGHVLLLVHLGLVLDVVQ